MELKKIFCIDYLPFKVTPLYRRILNVRGANGFSPEKPLFTITIDASIAKEYYKRLGVKFFRTRFTPITMVVYIT